MPEKFSDDKRKDVINTYNMTQSIASAARTCGVSYTWARNVLVYAGVIKPRVSIGSVLPLSAMLDVKEELEKGRDPLEIASLLLGGDKERWYTFGTLCHPDEIPSWQWGQLLATISSGEPIEAAAYRAGFKPGMAEEWEQRAKAKEGEWPFFWLVLRCVAGAAVELLQERIRQGGQGWQGAAWLLERMGVPGYDHRGDKTGEDMGGLADKTDEELAALARAALGVEEKEDETIVSIEDYQ